MFCTKNYKYSTEEKKINGVLSIRHDCTDDFTPLTPQELTEELLACRKMIIALEKKVNMLHKVDTLNWIEKDEIVGDLLINFLESEPNTPLNTISSKILRRLMIKAFESGLNYRNLK